MDQYPDENEEFELMYQDELELLNEFPTEDHYGLLISTTTEKGSVNQLNYFCRSPTS